MTTRTWVGGGNNAASNPNDWSPVGAPQHGDTLNMGAGTINVHDNVLAGNTLHLTGQEVTDTINVTGNTSLNWDAKYFDNTTVNLGAHSKWIGGFSVYPGNHVTVNGPGKFANETSYIDGTTVINADVVGSGKFSVFASHSQGKLEFMHSVSGGQSVAVSGYKEYGGEFGVLQIDDPKNYHAATTLGFGEIILKGLEAHSYSLKGDMLTLFNHGKAVDTMRLNLGAINGYGPESFGVSQTAAGVVVHADSFAYKDGGTLLSLHA